MEKLKDKFWGAVLVIAFVSILIKEEVKDITDKAKGKR